MHISGITFEKNFDGKSLFQRCALRRFDANIKQVNSELPWYTYQLDDEEEFENRNTSSFTYKLH